jgi:hypothetical protein
MPDDLPPLPRMMRLPMDELHIDATYHPTVNAEAFWSILRDFLPQAVGIMLVHRRSDGTDWVVDGATRVLAFRHLDLPDIRAEVVEGWTLEQERDAYQLRNTIFPKHPMDIYKAQLLASGIIPARPSSRPLLPAPVTRGPCLGASAQGAEDAWSVCPSRLRRCPALPG